MCLESVKVESGFGDVERFRLGQEYDDVDVQVVITDIPVRKPGKQEFFRVNPFEGFQMDVGLLEFQADRQFYVVAPGLRECVAEHCSPVTLYTVINRFGQVFLWPAKLPRPGAPVLGWHQSSHRAAELAVGQWVRIAANQRLRAYDVVAARGDLPEPAWPDMTFDEMFALAFEGRIIDRADHPIVRELEGRE